MILMQWGDIKAGAFAGGLIGHMDYWVSIANSYATSNMFSTSFKLNFLCL